MVVNLVHKETGIRKYAPMGFSWSTLFLGCIPAFYRGDWKWGLIMFALGVITSGISWAIFPFFYNRVYLQELIASGYSPQDKLDAYVLEEKGILLYE